MLILLQGAVAVYILFMFHLCCGPLRGDPEKKHYLAVEPILCLGLCRDFDITDIIAIQKKLHETDSFTINF